MKHGGRRKGAGAKRKWDSKNRPTIFDFWTDADISEYFEFLKDNYKEDMRLMQWTGDHLLGKAPQPIDAEMSGTLEIKFDSAFKDASTPTSEEYSE